MAIEVKEGRFFSRFFFGDLPGANLLAALYRDEGDDDWSLLFRIRVFFDNKVHDSDDESRWWLVKIRNRTPLRATFEAKRALTVVLMDLGGSGDLEEVVVDSDDETKVTETLIAQPWASVRMEGHHAKA